MGAVTKRRMAVFSSVDENETATESALSVVGEARSNDGLLLEKAGAGDTASFEMLFHRHYDRVYGILFRLVGERAEAEDLAQEVFLKLLDHSRKRRRGDEENVSAWLYRVATNLGYNALRGRRRRWQRDTVLLPEVMAGSGAEEAAAQREERARVRAALARIGARPARLLVLRQMGFSYAECASICEVATGSVGTLLARAARDFRQAYQRGD